VSAPAERIPVFLLTGFLGSGKTTLLNAALRAPGMEHTAVVVNELGDIGLDNLIIAEATDNVVLLDAGCLCCANTGALHETLADLGGRRARGEIPPFRRVIIETSGAADPAPLLNVLLGHPLVTSTYALSAIVCVVDAQHFLDSRARYPELDKQAAMAERIVIAKQDLADKAPVAACLKQLNPAADIVEGAAAFSAYEKTRKPFAPFATLGPIRSREHYSGIRAHAFRPPPPVSWSGWSAWSRLVAAEFGARLIRVKGLLHIDEGRGDGGEIAFVQGVQGVFHAPQKLKAWPDADHGNRLVCIARDVRAEDIAATLPALNTAPGTQAIYSLRDLQDLQQRQAQQ
jgi:G3E family GTPase